jgi:bifunctional non-homologous end joining protein LigD
LYFYYVQHTKGKTIISPFPPRGNPKAAVATPLHWEEVHTDLTMEMFQIVLTLLERLIRFETFPFAHFFESKRSTKFRSYFTVFKK